MTGRVRTAVAVVLIAVACLLAIASVTARWTRSELLDTDRYVATVAPLAQDPVVQDAIADRLTREVLDAVDVPATVDDLLRSLGEAVLPNEALTLIPILEEPIVRGIEGFIDEQIHRAVRSELFADAWVTAHRLAHRSLVAGLTGDRSGPVSVVEDEVSLDLAALVATIKQTLIDRGFTLAEAIPAVSGQFVLLRSDALADARRAADVLDTTATILPWITLVLFVGGVALARSTWLALLGASSGLAVAMLVVLAARGVGEDWFVEAIPDGTAGDLAAAVIWTEVTRFLAASATTILWLAVVVVALTLLAGPWRWAVAARRPLVSIPSRLAALLPGGRPAASGLTTWVATHIGVLRAVIAVAALCVLIAWRYPSTAVVVGVGLAAVVVWLLVETLAASAQPRDDRRVEPLDPASSLAT